MTYEQGIKHGLQMACFEAVLVGSNKLARRFDAMAHDVQRIEPRCTTCGHEWFLHYKDGPQWHCSVEKDCVCQHGPLTSGLLGRKVPT